MMRTKRPLSYLYVLCLFAASAVLLTGCGRNAGTFDIEEARGLVQRYNEVVIEAYRRLDIKLVDDVVGPNERRKLAGLIGVRQDMGITLDSELLLLEMVSVKQHEESKWLEVRTREKWRYLDRKIGTGEQVGEESDDEYEMIYVFINDDGRWLVDKIKFAVPPKVGRPKPLWSSEPTYPNGGMVLPHSGGQTNKP